MVRPVKSWIGEISANSSRRASRLNHSNESRWIWIKFGTGAASAIRAKDLRPVGTSGKASTLGWAAAIAMQSYLRKAPRPGGHYRVSVARWASAHTVAACWAPDVNDGRTKGEDRESKYTEQPSGASKAQKLPLARRPPSMRATRPGR